MNWQPLGDIVFVRPLMAPESTSQGIVIPDANRSRPSRGIVLAVGPGLAAELTGKVPEIEIESGDLVMFGQFAGQAEELEGEPVLLLRFQECLARVPLELSDGLGTPSFTITEHLDESGRKLYHLGTESCPRCPSVLAPGPDLPPAGGVPVLPGPGRS